MEGKEKEQKGQCNYGRKLKGVEHEESSVEDTLREHLENSEKD